MCSCMMTDTTIIVLPSEGKSIWNEESEYFGKNFSQKHISFHTENWYCRARLRNITQQAEDDENDYALACIKRTRAKLLSASGKYASQCLNADLSDPKQRMGDAAFGSMVAMRLMKTPQGPPPPHWCCGERLKPDQLESHFIGC